MNTQQFQAWWDKHYFYTVDQRYRHFKKIADLDVNLDYVDHLLSRVTLREYLDAIAKGPLLKQRRNEIRKQKARARILGVRLVPVKQNAPPSELGLLGLLLWKYGPPKPAARGGQEDNWGTFILLAITEHFLARPKKPRYADAMALLFATRNKSQRPRRDLRQTAINRIKDFKKKYPDWKEGLELLEIDFFEYSQLRKHGYHIIRLPDPEKESLPLKKANLNRFPN